MVADNALQDNVAFHDAVPYHAVSNFYARANVVVNPSLSESFGRSLIEAMAFGLPVVATAVGGMPEIVTHEREGLLVEAERPAALAGALLDLLERPERAAEMGRAGRKTVEERFTWDRIAADALAVYDDLHEREARRG
jgi:glycosyltransferase involved in cell wall biosynthesis